MVNGVGGTNTVHIDHAFSQYGNDLLHQELAHVELVGVCDYRHVLLDCL